MVVEIEHKQRTEELKKKGVSFHSRENGETRPNGLMDFLRFKDMLPTPQTQGLKVCDENGKTQFMDLDLLPTPTAQDNPHPTGRVDENGRRWTEGAKASHSMGLSDLASMDLLPTPMARCWKGGTTEVRKDTGKVRVDQLDTYVQVLSQDAEDGASSRLSPLFTEEMMGFPLMYTTYPFLSTSETKTRSSSGEPKA